MTPKKESKRELENSTEVMTTKEAAELIHERCSIQFVCKHIQSGHIKAFPSDHQYWIFRRAFMEQLEELKKEYNPNMIRNLHGKQAKPTTEEPDIEEMIEEKVAAAFSSSEHVSAMEATLNARLEKFSAEVHERLDAQDAKLEKISKHLAKIDLQVDELRNLARLGRNDLSNLQSEMVRRFTKLEQDYEAVFDLAAKEEAGTQGTPGTTGMKGAER